MASELLLLKVRMLVQSVHCNLCLYDDEHQPLGRSLLQIKARSLFLTAVTFAILWMVLAVCLHAQDVPFHDAPSSSIHLKNPYAGQPTAVAAGSRLYATNCSSCHGSHGQGNAPLPALSTGPTQSASDGEVFWFITTGAPDKGMPSWSALSERQRWQLVTYLKSLKSSKGAEESGSGSRS
jgi:mono/diheme cytochrome c family protein